MHAAGQRDDRPDDEGHHGRTHPLEGGVNYRIVADVGEEQRNDQDDDERGDDDAQRRGHGAGVAARLVADEDRRVEGDGARDGLGQRQQVEEFGAADLPVGVALDLGLDERNHGVAAAEGEQTDSEEAAEEFKKFVHGV